MDDTIKQLTIKEKRHAYYIAHKKDKIDIELEKRLEFMNRKSKLEMEQDRKIKRAQHIHDYYIKNTEKRKTYMKEYYLNNIETYVAYKKQYDIDNFDRLHTYRLAYYQLHKKINNK